MIRRYLSPGPVAGVIALTIAAVSGAPSLSAKSVRGTITLTLQGAGSYTAMPTGRLIIVRTTAPVAPDTVARLRARPTFIDDARINQKRTMLILRLQLGVKFRHQATPDRRGVRFAFSKADLAAPARTGGAGQAVASRQSKDSQVAQLGDQSVRARTLILRLPRGTSSTDATRAIMAFNWENPVAVTYRVIGNEVFFRFQGASPTQTASIASAFRVAGYAASRPTGGNRLSFRLAFGKPVQLTRHQSAGRLTISLKLASQTSGPRLAAAARVGDPTEGQTPYVDLESYLGGHDLVISTVKPTALSAFRWRNHLWVVIPGRIRLDPRALSRQFGGAVKGLALTRYPEASVVRIALAGKPTFAVRRMKSGWRVAIAIPGAANARQRALGIGSDGKSAGGALLMPLPRSGQPVRVRDPETGQTLIVIPSRLPGVHSRLDQRFVRVKVLASLQGLAMVALSDGLVLKQARGRWRITHPNGMHLSRIPPS